MSKKTSRILIVDHHHLRRLYIEKMLNHLAYYRIAPMRSFDEVVAVTCSALESFDLVIVNTDAPSTCKDVAGFCRDNEFIRNFLLYSVQSTPLLPQHDRALPRNRQVVTGLPDIQSIKRQMDAIDPPSTRQRFSGFLLKNFDMET
jgi:hypothetical protein